jgi:uncharacterized protein (TIGR02452 family)
MSTNCVGQSRDALSNGATNFHTDSNTSTIRNKYYKSNKGEALGHELLRDATIVKSDYPSVRKIVGVWDSIVNAQLPILKSRPILSVFSIFNKSKLAYKKEIEAIAKLSGSEKKKIEDNTKSYGGETEEAYQKLCDTFKDWKKEHTKTDVSNTKVFFYQKSDSLGAARTFGKVRPNAKIAITNFANAVRVGGADSLGNKGSQEEQLFRTTYLRVSLEKAKRDADKEICSKTERYLQYYAAIVSRDVPTLDRSKTPFGVISVAAPDLRQGILHSEGKYFASQNNPTLVKEVLYRKLAVAMMAAAMEGFEVLVLGAFGCGAFGNNPKDVAEIIKCLINKPCFQGVFTDIILPIGTEDSNRKAFQNVFPLLYS